MTDLPFFLTLGSMFTHCWVAAGTLVSQDRQPNTELPSSTEDVMVSNNAAQQHLNLKCPKSGWGSSLPSMCKDLGSIPNTLPPSKKEKRKKMPKITFYSQKSLFLPPVLTVKHCILSSVTMQLSTCGLLVTCKPGLVISQFFFFETSNFI